MAKEKIDILDFKHHENLQSLYLFLRNYISADNVTHMTATEGGIFLLFTQSFQLFLFLSSSSKGFLFCFSYSIRVALQEFLFEWLTCVPVITSVEAKYLKWLHLTLCFFLVSGLNWLSFKQDVITVMPLRSLVWVKLCFKYKCVVTCPLLANDADRQIVCNVFSLNVLIVVNNRLSAYASTLVLCASIYSTFMLNTF